MFRAITACRACGNPALRSLMDLGTLALTGVFPKDPAAPHTRGPLELVQCDTARASEACGLVQLRQSYDAAEMYGDNYGYRSSLNRSMIAHLSGVAERLQRQVSLATGDLVLDIGSNDGTLLRCYPEGGPRLVGIDPTAAKFERYYRADIERIPEFFSAELVRSRFGGRGAKIVSAIAMFYDLERPLEFLKQVREVLAEDGVFFCEQSYLPSMLRQNSYDTICHEHLEYYALRQIVWMAERAGLALVDVTTSDVNGGSFAVTAVRAGAGARPIPEAVERALRVETALGLDGPEVYEGFRRRVDERKARLLEALDGIARAGESVLGYGASTKGNVILQYCGLGPERIPCIAEVNEDKFGCYTPGTAIPIVSEAEARARRPGAFLVLPWHFREGIVRRERSFLEGGGKLVFPLPEVDVVRG